MASSGESSTWSHAQTAPLAPEKDHCADDTSSDETFVESHPPLLVITGHVHGLTTNFLLNRPAHNLIPIEYLDMAAFSPLVGLEPWAFGISNNARVAGLDDWPEADVLFKSLFKTLGQCPEFERGLWEGGSDCHADMFDPQSLYAQGHTVHILLKDILLRLNLSRRSPNSPHSFHLTSRHVPTIQGYCTGFRQRFRDAGPTSGSICLEWDPATHSSDSVLNISPTLQKAPLKATLEEKFKQMIAQLVLHLRPLDTYADKQPDQEVFQIGIHGTKLHLLRAFFPGHKVSSLWCQRECEPAFPFPVTPCPSPASDSDEDNNNSKKPRTIIIPRRARIMDKTYWKRWMRLTRYHTNICALPSPFDHWDIDDDMSKFRVLGTREYDLTIRKDFQEAMTMLVALNYYLLSGKAMCGILQETFRRHPYSQFEMFPSQRGPGWLRSDGSVDYSAMQDYPSDQAREPHGSKQKTGTDPERGEIMDWESNAGDCGGSPDADRDADESEEDIEEIDWSGWHMSPECTSEHWEQGNEADMDREEMGMDTNVEGDYDGETSLFDWSDSPVVDWENFMFQSWKESEERDIVEKCYDADDESGDGGVPRGGVSVQGYLDDTMALHASGMGSFHRYDDPDAGCFQESLQGYLGHDMVWDGVNKTG